MIERYRAISDLFEVVQQPTALTHEEQQTTTAVVVVLVRP